MIYAEALMVTILVFIGGFCSYTDIRDGIVPNKVILFGFLLGCAIHGIYLLCGAAEYYPSWLINMAIADIAAFGMFFAKMWAAGDAKLFMLLYFLTPPRIFDSGTLTHSVVPYIFIFVPALFWMAVDSMVRLIRKEARIHQKISIKEIITGSVSVIIETTAFYCVWTCLFPNFVNQQAMLVAALTFVYAYVCGSVDVMKRWYAVALHAAVVIIMLIIGKWSITFPEWQDYLLMLFVVFSQRFCAMYNYQLIPTGMVKRGMILSMETVMLFRASRVKGLPNDLSEELTARISEEEANAVRRWGKSAFGKPNIWIVRKVPFAIMIFIGFVGWIGFRVLGR